MSRACWVVVPARDEARHIQACLRALEVAASAVRGIVHVVVVDDGSRDRTAAIAEAEIASWRGRLRGHVIAGPAGGVGWARRTGFEFALAHLRAEQDALLATTDADSTVAANWLEVMHRRLDEGHCVIAGDVLLDSSCPPPLAAARARRLERRLADLPPREAGAPHPHFAGSSLGFASQALRELCPLPTPTALEDHAILLACRARGIPVLRDYATRVTTSARLNGRVDAGLAAALSRDLLTLTAAAPLAGAAQPPT